MLFSVVQQAGWKHAVKVYLEVKVTPHKVAVIEIDRSWNVKMEVVAKAQTVICRQC